MAASLVVVEALLLLGYGVAELGALTGTRLVMGLTTALFFLVYGAGLVFCAWSLTRRQSWSRAPVVLAQLIQVLVAWSFVGGETTTVAVVLLVTALVVLAGVFHPASLSAMTDEGEAPST